MYHKRWSEELGLFLGIENHQLRYFTPEGELVASPQEAALQEMEKVKQQQQLIVQGKQRADRLAEYLQSLGVNPDNLPG